MKYDKNPWEGMKPARRRRVSEIYDKFECYWVTDYDGKYGYLIESNEVLGEPQKLIELMGITISINTDKTFNLILFLEEKENWEIFLDICNNLSSVAIRQRNAQTFMSAIQIRLARWQKILLNKINKSIMAPMISGKK